MKCLPLLIFSFLLSSHIYSQKIANEIIVNTVENNASLLRSIKSLNDKINYVELKPLSKSLNIYLLQLKTSDNSDVGKQVITYLEEDRDIEYAYYNQYTSNRATPSDPRYPNQWNLDLIKAEEAWELSTGGVDVNGEEVVIAIMDDGFDIDHEDIQNNLWVNPNEVAGDQLDNDFNSYRDDIHGIDLATGNGSIISESHGTAVMGIVGADSDNNVGITGINWNTKLMVLSSVTNEARVIEGYDYILEMRRKYNLSNGENGAYVVATNYSLGINEEFGEDHPAWCNMYDALGQEGIVSVGATTNSNKDVDIVGDLPTTCASPYFIGVTNSDRNDVKVTNAGFGKENIDLSAPGRNAESIKPESQYGLFGGTSASSPHVAGALGLLYTLKCENLAAFIKESPGEAALRIKEAILNGTDPLTSLNNVTVTGGRLNILNSMSDLSEFCSDDGTIDISGDLQVDFVRADSDNTYTIFYKSPDTREVLFNVYDIMGRKIYSTLSRPGLFSRSNERIDLSAFQSSIYIVTLELDGNVVSHKFRHISK